MKTMVCPESTSIIPRQSGSDTPNSQWKYDSYKCVCMNVITSRALKCKPLAINSRGIESAINVRANKLSDEISPTGELQSRSGPLTDNDQGLS